MTHKPPSRLWSTLVLLLALPLASSGNDGGTADSQHSAFDISLAIESLGEQEACDGALEASPRTGRPSELSHHHPAATRDLSPQIALYLLKHSLLI